MASQPQLQQTITAILYDVYSSNSEWRQFEDGDFVSDSIRIIIEIAVLQNKIRPENVRIFGFLCYMMEKQVEGYWYMLGIPVLTENERVFLLAYLDRTRKIWEDIFISGRKARCRAQRFFEVLGGEPPEHEPYCKSRHDKFKKWICDYTDPEKRNRKNRKLELAYIIFESADEFKEKDFDALTNLNKHKLFASESN